MGFGVPLPTLAWTRMDSDAPLLPPKFEEKFYNMTNYQGYAVAFLELKIHGTNRNDAGLYQCEGNNSILNLVEAQTIGVGRFLIEGSV